MALTEIQGSGIGTLTDTITIQPNSGNLIIKAGTIDATNSIRLEAGGTTSTYLEYRGYLGHQFVSNTSLAMTIDGNGQITMPLQPAFQARPATNQSDIAINGNREVVFGTEVFDNNSDFSSNTFTAPVTGKYLITYSLYLQNLDSAANYYEAFINTSNRTYYGSSIDPDFADADWNYHSLSSSCVVDMDANDTATININQSQGTAQTDIASPSFFSGVLVC